VEPDGDPPRVTTVTADVGEVAALYERACAPLMGLLASIGGSASDAEEIAHDAFVQLLANWESIREYEIHRLGLRTVAVRLLISRNRRRQVSKRGLQRLVARSQAMTPEPGPNRVAVEAALATLPVSHRAVLILHHALDMPVEKVAEVLQIPSGTVKSRLSRARHALAPLLRDEELTNHD